MINRGLTAYTQTSVRFNESTGYKFSAPLATTLTAAGITGADQTELIAVITAMVKANNNGNAPVATFGTNTRTLTLSPVRTIPSMYYQTAKGSQSFKSTKYTIKLSNFAGTTIKTVEITTIAADMTSLTYQLFPYDTHAHGLLHGHDHGLGGGGSI